MPKTPKFTQKVGILLFPEFSMHCLANTVEPLRAANTLSGRTLYEWRYLGTEAGRVVSSSGLPVETGQALRDHPGGAWLFVLPSYGYNAFVRPEVLRPLAAAAGRFDMTIGLDAGSYLMAAAGLLDGRRATIHWDELTRLAETYPQVDTVTDRFVIDGPRASCGGAMTAFELVLDLIGRQHGAMLRLEVASLFMHGERPAQGAALGATLGETLATGDRSVLAAVARMRRTVERPLPLPALARALGMSLRKMETRFLSETGRSPGAVYRRVRLQEAHRLIQTTDLRIPEIATRCGYEDASAMTRAFRREFGTTPRAVRNGARA